MAKYPTNQVLFLSLSPSRWILYSYISTCQSDDRRYLALKLGRFLTKHIFYENYLPPPQLKNWKHLALYIMKANSEVKNSWAIELRHYATNADYFSSKPTRAGLVSRHEHHCWGGDETTASYSRTQLEDQDKHKREPHSPVSISISHIKISFQENWILKLPCTSLLLFQTKDVQ